MSRNPIRTRAHAPALAALALLAALSPGTAARADWLPLAVGNQWVYMDETDEPHTEAITDEAHVRGRRMFVKSYLGGQDDGLVNFWKLDTDGSLLLGGYYRAAYPFGLVYEPPVKIFPGSPVVNQEWTTHTVAIAIPDNVIYAEFDLYWKVQEQVTVPSPAGTFECVGVGQVAPPAFAAAPGGAPLALDGTVIRPAEGPLDNGPSSATEWYADGVGLVRYDTGVPYLLQSYDLVTPAVTSSWGRLKRLYR